MNLPLVNVFSEVYEVWSCRPATLAELQQSLAEYGYPLLDVKDKLIYSVKNPLEAAKYICQVDMDNGLGIFINKALDESVKFRSWRKAMPSKTPVALSKYQKVFPHFDANLVDNEINRISHCLSEGQVLFHGGLWPGGCKDQYITQTPFSTTFCPQVALRNAEFLGKAYAAGSIDLMALYVKHPRTNVFCYRRAGTNLGHENEVLFASGACLRLVGSYLMRDDYKVYDLNGNSKMVNVFVREVFIS